MARYQVKRAADLFVVVDTSREGFVMVDVMGHPVEKIVLLSPAHADQVADALNSVSPAYAAQAEQYAGQTNAELDDVTQVFVKCEGRAAVATVANQVVT